MDITNIILEGFQIANPKTQIIKEPTYSRCYITGTRDVFAFKDGKPTDEKVNTAITAVFMENKFEKVAVKLPVTTLVTNEIIEENGGTLEAWLENLTGRFYRTANGDYALSCKADAIHFENPTLSQNLKSNLYEGL